MVERRSRVFLDLFDIPSAELNSLSHLRQNPGSVLNHLRHERTDIY